MTLNIIKKRFRICIIYLIALLFIIPCRVSAEDAPDDTKIVRIGYYENDNFQAGAGENLVKSGYSYEYMRRLETYTSWKYEYVYGEYGDLYQMLLDGEIDLLTGLAYREERATLISYPDLAMGSTSYVFLKRIDSEDITSDPASIAGRKIGALDGAMKGIVDHYLRTNAISAEIVLYDDLSERDDALQKGDVDLIIVEGSSTGILEDVESFVDAGESDYYVVVNKNRPDLLTDLNQAQKELFAAQPDLKDTLNDKWLRTNAASTSLSTEEKAWVKEHPEITIGYFDNYLPFSDTDEEGNVTGVVKDLVPAMFRALRVNDIKITYQGYESYAELIKALETNEIDAAFPIYNNFWANENYNIILNDPAISTYFNLVYTGSYPDTDHAVIALRESNQLVQDFARVNYPNAEIILYDSVPDCLDAVADGKADATIIGGLRTDYIIRSKSSYRSLVVSQIAEDAPLGFATGRKGRKTADILEHGLLLLESDFALTNSYQYIEKQKITVSEFLADNFWIVILIIILILLLLVAFVSREFRKSREHLMETEKQKAELQKAKDEAEAAQKAAEVANKAKTTFLFNMSHDIRTPLNAIIGFTELEEKNPNDQEKNHEYRKKVAMASHQLLDILNNVLEMARIENRKLVIEEELTDAHEFFDTWTSVFEGEIRNRNQKFELSTDVTHKYLYLDRTHLSELLMNVVSNAIKYTPVGGTIYAGIRELPSEKEGECIIETRVRDNGIGMSEEFVSKIFEEFSRERTSSQSGIQGTGLGMAIVKELTELMHGTIEIHSAIGEGTEVIIRLPHRYGEAPADQTKTEVSDQTDFVGKRILLAEDIDVNAILATEILTMQGFEVERAKDGVECVDLLSHAENGYYDLILMDIQMPNMNGYEAAAKIRHMSDPAKASIPILAMTANAFAEDRQAAMDAGMNGHIAKPLDVNNMLNIIRSVLH